MQARFRLRDLRDRDRRVALGLLALVLVPFAVALVRASRDGWVPSGDEANIATRALDVFSHHPPLTGLPSTSGLYGAGISTNHPGPIEFYLLAAPLRVFGMSAGPLLTAAAINAGFVLIALWAFFRRLGLTAMLWSGVLVLAVMWSGGTAVLTDTLSSNMTMYSLLCTAVLAWALVDGDIRLLPLAAFVASYAAQQHLAAGLIVLVLIIVAIGALAAQVVTHIRRDPTIRRIAVRWTAAAAAVGGVCWLPVVIDQFTGHPGNITAIARFARDNNRPTLGFTAGVYQALHAVTPPTVLARTNTTGFFFAGSPGLLGIGFGVLIAAALGALAWRERAHSRALARLALVALVLLAAGIVDGSNVPDSAEASRVNLYRWSWTAALLTWSALGLGGALFVARRWEASRADRTRRLAPVALLVVAALIATAIASVAGPDDHNRERLAFALEKRIATAVLARVDRQRPVLIVSDGTAANLSVSPYVIFRLIDAGIRVEVPDYLAHAYGSHRKYRPQPGASALVIVSGGEKLRAAPGTLIATQHFSPERSALLDELSAAAFGKQVELAPGARARIDREFTGDRRRVLNALIAMLPTNPRGILETPEFVRLLLDGLLRSPRFDRAKLVRLAELPYNTNTLGNDERVEVRLVGPDELRATGLPRL